MQHFPVIQSLCRIGLQSQDPAFRQQVDRLRERLEKSGDTKDAETLSRLLKAQPNVNELAPTKVELSRFPISGEPLTAQTHPPVDRETSQALCRVILNPATYSQRPVLSEHEDVIAQADIFRARIQQLEVGKA